MNKIIILVNYKQDVYNLSNNKTFREDIVQCCCKLIDYIKLQKCE